MLLALGESLRKSLQTRLPNFNIPLSGSNRRGARGDRRSKVSRT